MRERKLFPKERQRLIFLAVVGLVSGNPGRVPLRRLSPMACAAPAARMFLLVPHFHSPLVRVLRSERRPRVDNARGFVALHHAAVPKNSARRGKVAARGNHLNAVRRLLHSVHRGRRRLQLPRERRLRIRNRQRLARPRAAQIVLAP